MDTAQPRPWRSPRPRRLASRQPTGCFPLGALLLSRGSPAFRAPLQPHIGSSTLWRALTALLLPLFALVVADIPPTGDLPKFVSPINNVTFAVGREAVLTCVVENLGNYKVAWLQVDTQTILTIHGNVITKNNRIKVTHADQRVWTLHIRNVSSSDRGWYMCQLNTDPMKSQIGYLDVVVPPNILDYHTSTDMVVREGRNVTLRCMADGFPLPSITWRREDNKNILLGNGFDVASLNGTTLTIQRVDRLSMGAYLCIASNGVPPSVSKRLRLIVHFPPMITIPNQLVGAVLGHNLTLECLSEAYPKSINYWMRNDEIVANDSRHESSVHDKDYSVTMRLHIRNIQKIDFSSYKCVSKNNLGDTDGLIKVEEIVQSTMIPTTPSTPHIIRKGKKGRGKDSRENNDVLSSRGDNSVEKYRGDVKKFDDHFNNNDISPPESKGAFSSSSSNSFEKLSIIGFLCVMSPNILVHGIK